MQNCVIIIRITCLYGSQPLSVAFARKTVTFGAELQVCMGPWPHLSFCACKTAWLASELLVSRVPALVCGFWLQNSAFCTRITSLHRYQTSPVVLCIQISVISTRITILYVSQTSLVVLCLQNSVISTKSTSLYGFQPSSVVLCIQNSAIKTKIASLYGSQTSLVIFCMQNSVPSIWITSLYGSQCGFWMQYSVISPRKTCLYGSQPLSVAFACKTATFGTELQVCMGPSLHMSFCACKSPWLATE